MQPRTITELVERYRRYPEFADVYVEGSTDRLVFTWFLRAVGLTHVQVYEIGTVEVPDESCKEHGVDVGNRGRVLVLASYLEKNLGTRLQVACIADRDGEAGPPSSRYTQFTDWSDLECYAFDDYHIEKFLRLGLRLERDAAGLVRNIGMCLVSACALRRANHQLGWGMEWVPLQGSLDAHRAGVTFDEAGFVSRYLSKNARLSDRMAFEEKYRLVRSGCAGVDERHNIRGHDVCEILYAYAVKVLGGKNPFRNADGVSRYLLSLVELKRLRELPLFGLLEQLFKPT
jgi:hypothetical protein